MRAKSWSWMVLVLLLAAGCGEAPPAPLPTAQSTALPPPGTAAPYPWPTYAPPPSLPPTPVPTPAPTPIVLGAEWAPEAEREAYVSTTVVVARVGDGPGEVGLYRPPYTETLPIHADHFAVDVHGNIYILDQVNLRVAQFDSQGHFVTNIPYGDVTWGAEDLAVDAKGLIYLYAAYGSTPHEPVPKVELLDPSGKLLREYPRPSWFVPSIDILAMRVDAQGTLWVEGYQDGSYSNAPIIAGEPYLAVTVPLGNATEVFNEERQKAIAVSGHLLPSGKPMIVRSLTAAGPAFVYNSSGQPIYQVVEGISAIDLAGNLYYIQYKDGGKGYTIIKWDPKGQRIASFDLPLGDIRIEGDGTVYCLTMDWQTWSSYRVVRAQYK